MGEQSFCFLKGLVDCSSGRVQDCNMKHTSKCMLEEEVPKAVESDAPPQFCFLKGIVECSPGRVQDCNMKRLNQCMLEKK